MSCDTEQILLEIIDDGAGFAVPDTFRDLTQGGHFGLVGMRERVNLIGGQWGLASTPGKGTRVTVTLPVSSVE
jgi:two-component system sensor histidine kinase DegS